MVRWLRKKHFRVYPLSICDITRGDADDSTHLITKQHVVLVSLICGKDESSWFILYDDVAFHNGGRLEIGSLFFLNKPIRSAYLISHPKWEQRRLKQRQKFSV